MNIIRDIGLIEMYEKIRKLEITHWITNEEPYSLKLDDLTYLWMYPNPGNIYLVNKKESILISKEEALKLLQPYLRKYKLEKIKI